MEPTEITAGRLHLRPWQPEDAEAVLAACTDPDVQRWTTVPSPYTEVDARAWVEQIAPGLWAGGTGAPFAVLDATTGALLASVGLHGIDGGRAELGYWSAPEARGQGVVGEAVGAVSRWAFGALGLQRLSWEAEVGNWPSRAVAERAGFTVEGVRRRAMRHRGELVDCWAGGLLATDEVVDRRAFGGRWRDLTGEGLVLRQWRRDDADAVLAGLSNAESARWLPVPSPYTAEDARAFVETAPHRWVSGHSAALCVQVDGQVAGLVVLMPSTLDRGLAELGWWTAPWARGRGVAARAVRVLVPWAAGLGVRRFEAGVDVDNLASQRVAERAGMTREGLRRAGLRPSRDGVRADGLLYALVP
ncbi:MAG: family N-acetyltransferase [Frankiales bacterium]|nr:family N-acetyltransferase [Frankiales bacterium]